MSRRVLLPIALLVTAVGAAEEPSFSSLAEKADHVASHGEGMRYANHTKSYLVARAEGEAKSCLAANAEKNARFDMLVWVAKDGTIDKARVEPESAVAACVAKAVVGTRVGPPDAAPWVVHVEWDVTAD